MNELKVLYDGALALEKKGKHQDAIKYYQEVIRLDPNFRAAYNNMGAIYARMGRQDLSIPCFERALALGADETVHFNLGTEYFRKEDLEKAREHLKAALRINQRLLRAHIVLAYLYEKAQLPEKAEIYFKNALTIEPENRIAALGMAVSLSGRGQEERALAVVRSYLSRKPGDETFANLQASLLLATGRTEESRTEFLKLAKSSKDYTSFTDHVRAVRSENQGEFAQMFEGMDKKIAERTRRVLQLRKERAAKKAQSPDSVLAPEEKKQEMKDLMDLSFLHLFQGDSDKALQLLFQAKKLAEEPGSPKK